MFVAAGREVASLVNGDQHAGRYRVEWKGVDNNGSPVASGVYYARIITGGRVSVQKMLLVR